MNSIKNKKNSLILFYLQNKINNIYLEKGQSQFNKKAEILFNEARILKKDLKASPFYLYIENDKEVFSIKYELQKGSKRTFLTFNNNIIEYIFTKNNLYNNINEFLYSKINNYSGVREILSNVQKINSLIEKGNILPYQNTSINEKIINNFFKQDTLTFKNILSSLNINSFHSLFQIIEKEKENFDFDTFKFLVVDKLIYSMKNEKKLGVFLLYNLKNNILEQEYTLLEINHIKKNKIDYSTKKKLDDFYSNNNSITKSMKEETTTKFDLRFSYIDPYLLFTTFEKEFNLLFDNVSKNNIKIKFFFNELLELLNELQFYSVKGQHINLIDSLLTQGQKSRKKSFKDLILTFIEDMEYLKDEKEYPFYRGIAEKFLKTEIEGKKSSSYTIEDFPLFTEKEKVVAQPVLNQILKILGKRFRLKSIYQAYKIKILKSLYKYQLNSQSINLINDIIISILFFHEKYEKKDLNNTLSPFMRRISQEIGNKSIDSYIQFDKEKI